MSEGVRRIIGLDVNEVSLVDHPAIERKFVVVKRVEKSVWSTAQQNELPDSSFLYCAPGGKKDASGKTTPRSLRHFPVKDADGKIDLPHLRNALARIPQSNLPPDVKKSCAAEAEKMLSSASKEAEKASPREINDEVAKFLALGEGDIAKSVPELASAITAVVPWMQKMADQTEGAGRVAILRCASMLSQVNGGTMTTTKTDMTEEEKRKAAADAAKRDVGDEVPAGKAKPKAPGIEVEVEPGDDEEAEVEPGMGKKVKREKAKAEPVAMLMSDGTMQECVSKAGKRKYLTAGRMGGIADAAQKMMSILKEADEETAKSIVRNVWGEGVDPMEFSTGTGSSDLGNAEPKGLPRDPADAGGGSDVRPSGTRGGKTYEEKMIAAIEKALAPVAARLEKIEKSRSPSTALPDGQPDNPGTETDVKKSFWSNVL